MEKTETQGIFYPDLGDLATPEPGQVEGLTLKPYEGGRNGGENGQSPEGPKSPD